MVDAKSKPKSYDEEKQKRNSKGFDSVFKEACEELQSKDSITYHTTGYTRTAMSFDENYKKREYV